MRHLCGILLTLLGRLVTFLTLFAHVLAFALFALWVTLILSIVLVVLFDLIEFLRSTEQGEKDEPAAMTAAIKQMNIQREQSWYY